MEDELVGKAAVFGALGVIFVGDLLRSALAAGWPMKKWQTMARSRLFGGL